MQTGNPHDDAHWKRWMLSIWLLMCCALVAFRWTNIDFLILADTDDNLRLAQVESLLGGQGWYDLRQYRLNPPVGADVHWSRLVDLPIAAIMLIVKPFFGVLAAEKAAVALAPMIPFGVAMLGICLTARRLVDKRAWAFAAALLVCAPSTMNMFMPTRIDHHGWQLAFLALTLAGLVDERRVRGGLTVGLACAASLSIGLEMLPYLAMCGGFCVLRWVLDREDAVLIRAYGIALAAGTALGFLVFASEANRAPRCDALSPVWLSVMVFAGAIIAGLSFLRVDRWFSRLAAAGLGGVAIVAAFVLAWPQCLGRPEGISDELYRLWFVNIREVKPLYEQTLKTAMSTAALPVMGLVGSVWMLRRDRDHFILWGPFALLNLASVILLFWQTRAGAGAQLLGVPGATALAWHFVPRLAKSDRFLVRVFGVIFAFLLISGLIVNFVFTYVPMQAPSSKLAAVQSADARCPTLSALRPIAKQTPGVVYTFVDLGPRLIAMTPHKAIAGPYHRNGDAILDVFHVFRGTPETALPIIRAHHADYVLICINSPEATNHRRFAPNGLYARLEKGLAPEWLTPVPLPADSPYRMWRVAPAK